MTSIELEKLFDSHPDVEAEAIVTSALESRRYKLEMKAAAVSALLVPILLSLLVFWLIKSTSPSMPVRFAMGLLSALSIFLGVKLVFPINDKLVDRAIHRELASRGRGSAP